MNEKETRKIDKVKYEEKRKFFVLSKKELESLAEKGNDKAIAELKRREVKKKKKKKGI
jgi:hypothetical protein